MVKSGSEGGRDAERRPGYPTQSRLPLSTTTLVAIRCEIVGYRREARSRWGKKSAGQLTDLVAAVLLHDARPGDLAGISAATVRHWLHRVIDRLARRACRLDWVLRKVVVDGHAWCCSTAPTTPTTRQLSRSTAYVTRGAGPECALPMELAASELVPTAAVT
jgi:hypothetical protein